ncbi:MAG: ABC transporter substrate-binding protein [Rhodospirillales bacterium]|nr:ABC transporter substrate-binding protein [Rhodospirillales bacterium]MBO6786277.1 ABC transporter substrate-binding protein [Rhodospirillales bacterium]
MSDAPSDFLGNTHPPAPDARVVSLVPSLTELMFDLGLAERLVGRTHYCIHPDDRVSAVPSVGGTKKIKMDRVRELAPTHVLVNVDENPKQMADTLRDMGVDVIVTHPMHPDDNPALYTLIGHAFDADAAAETLATRYALARTELNSGTGSARKNVLYLIWKNPWMAISGDTYIANMLRLVNWQVVTPGADPELSGDAGRYPGVKLDEDTLDGVDLVLFSTEPFTFTDEDIEAFKRTFPAHAGKAHLIDGEMTSWYGSRAIRGLTYLRDFADDIGK